MFEPCDETAAADPRLVIKYGHTPSSSPEIERNWPIECPSKRISFHFELDVGDGCDDEASFFDGIKLI